MNRNPKSPIILFVLCLAVSCSDANVLQTAAITAAVKPTLLPPPTETSSPSPVPSETPVISQKILRSCVKLDLNNESGISLQGTAVFENLTPELVITIFLRDLARADLRIITNAGSIENFWGISPDRRYLLYEYDNPSKDHYYLVVADSLGQPVTEFDTLFPNDPYTAAYYNWQNDEDIRVVLFSESREAFSVSPRIYDPFTGDYRALKTEFPGYIAEDLDWGLDWIALRTLHLESANIVYDPSLSRVLYPKNGEIVSLIDVESGKELASIQLSTWGRLPKWSPDGNYIALIGTSKLVLGAKRRNNVEKLA